MVEVKKYPTDYDNPDNWTNPQYACNVEDSLCAVRLRVGVFYSEITVKTYGFAIPSDAVIDGVYYNAKANKTTGLSTLTFRIQKGANFSTVTFPAGLDCVDTAFAGEVDITSWGWTPDDLNLEWDLDNQLRLKTYYALQGLGSGNHVGRVDADYIRVVYHIPPPVAYAPGDGLVWIISMVKPKIGLKEFVMRYAVRWR